MKDLNLNELENIDGGIDWNGIGLGASMTSGGILGAKIGAVGGGLGMAIGTIVGGVAGGIVYSIAD